MENVIRKFKINKNNPNSYLLSKIIFNNIIKLSNTTTSKLILNNFSNIFEMPKGVLKIKYNRLIHDSFNYSSSKFNNNIFISGLLKESMKSIIIFLILLFPKKDRKINNYNFIINGIDDERAFQRYEKLIKKFKSSLVISSRRLKIKKKKISFLKNSKFNRINYFAVKGKRLKIFYLFLKVLIQSIIKNFNYIYFFNLILFSIISNYSIFYNNRGKYFMEDRFYNTCSIRNYFFKKFGGKVTSTPQKNIVDTCISLFLDTDIFFSLGDEKYSVSRLRKFGGRINKSIPVGSFFLEHDWYRKRKDLSKVPKNEILIMGLNPNTFLQINNLNYRNYEYISRKWVKDISKLYPKAKVMIKHHSNLKDNSLEKNFFEDSNVVSLIDDNSNNRSYGYIYQSKIIFSFASTTTLEAISMNKQSYFIDPGFGSTNFFYDLNNLNKIRVGSFESFKKIIKKNLLNNFKKNLDRNKYCLKSDKVSERVYKYYKTLK